MLDLLVRPKKLSELHSMFLPLAADIGFHSVESLLGRRLNAKALVSVRRFN